MIWNSRQLEDLSKEVCAVYLIDIYKLVSLDPGKISPVTMIDENNKLFKYTACRRRFETYTKRSHYIILQEKKKNGIIQNETYLSNFKSRTTKVEEYKNSITNKTILNNEVKEFYQKPLFRKLAFRRFIRTKQSEVKLLTETEPSISYQRRNKTRKKDCYFTRRLYYEQVLMKGCISTPNIGII